MTILCAIPVFNHAATLADVVERARKHLPVLVVDDGSTDWSDALQQRLEALGAQVIHHPRNLGKGAAIQTALQSAADTGMDYLITLDADGQHSPDDLPKFMDAIQSLTQETILVGCRDFPENAPRSSRFGRTFANFWFRVESGAKCGDCQSGFRAYPVQATLRLKCTGRRYSYEAEVLARAVWGGIVLQELPISVSYPPDRISHFDKFRDNLRLSAIHARLVLRRLIPWDTPWVVERPKPRLNMMAMLRHPWETLKQFMTEYASPWELALSAVVATILGVLPIIGVHVLAIFYVTTRLHLNRPLALTLQNLYAPPVTPFLCIELGYYYRHGKFLTSLNFQNLVVEMPQRYLEWFYGSLVLAPLFALIAGTAVYCAAWCFQRSRQTQDDNTPLSATRGNRFGFWFFRTMLKCLGLNITAACIWPISLFYALFDREAARRARPSLDALHPGQNPLARFFHRWRLFTRQGQAILLLHYLQNTGKSVPMDYEIHPDALPYLENSTHQGCLALNSHFGCWQAALAYSYKIQRPILFMVHPDQQKVLDKFQALHARNDAHAVEKLNTLTASAGGLLDAMTALQNGTMVGIMGDRGEGAATLEADFPGGPLKLSPVPWLLAARNHTPVLLFLVALQHHPIRLLCHISQPIQPADSEKRLKPKDMIPYANLYAKEIADFAKRFPDQWFKFES